MKVVILQVTTVTTDISSHHGAGWQASAPLTPDDFQAHSKFSEKKQLVLVWISPLPSCSQVEEDSPWCCEGIAVQMEWALPLDKS